MYCHIRSPFCSNIYIYDTRTQQQYALLITNINIKITHILSNPAKLFKKKHSLSRVQKPLQNSNYPAFNCRIVRCDLKVTFYSRYEATQTSTV